MQSADRPGPAQRLAAASGHSTGAAALVLVLLVVYAAWAVRLEPFSGEAAAAVVLPGAAAMVLGARQRRSGPPDSPAGLVRWVVLAGVIAAWQLAAFLQHPRSDHPTVSSLTNAALDSHVTRAAAFVLWIAAARELARR